MPYSSARPSDIPPDLPNNESIEDAFADTPEFAAAPNNDDDSTPESNEINSNDGEYAPSRRLRQRITRATNIQRTRNPAEFNENRILFGEDTARFIAYNEHRYAQLTGTENTAAPPSPSPADNNNPPSVCKA